jgi:hypothetical protein
MQIVSYNRNPFFQSWDVIAKKENTLFMPKGRRAGTDTSLFQAALLGFEQMKRDVEERIAEIRGRLGFGGSAGTQAAATAKPKRTLSLVARRKIAAAQKKRWALLKAKEAKPKRVLSVAARRRIAAAQRKRWALTKAQAAASPAQMKPAKKTPLKAAAVAQGA